MLLPGGDSNMLRNIFDSNWQKYTKMTVLGLTSITLVAVVMAIVLTNRTAPHIYIALGDSVSSGYGLTGYAPSPVGRHSSLFFEKLEYEGFVDEYHNMAKSGFTTSMLLEMLNNMNNNELRLFQNARVITLNIGGNNILTPFLAYLSDLQLLSGADNIRTGVGGVLSGTWGVLYEIISGVESVLSDTGETSFRIGEVITGFGDIISGLGGLIAGAGEIIAGSHNVVTTWRGLPSTELEVMLADSIQTFSQDFREIIMWLERNAPKATVIVNTIYNPIPQDILRVSVPISNWANTLIESINHTIISESELRGFLVTDIYFYVSNRPDLMNFNFNPFAGSLSLDIVHPNADGHNLIAQLNHATFIQYIQEKHNL